MWLQGLWLVTLIPALVIGIHLDGIQGVGIGHLVVAGGIMVPAYLVALRVVGLRGRDVGAPLLGPLLGSAVALVLGLTLVPQVGNPVLAMLLAGVLAVAGPLIPVSSHLRELGTQAVGSWAERRNEKALAER